MKTLDHKQFLAQVPGDRRAVLTRRSDRRGLLHLAGHLGLVLGCGLWIALGLPLWWLLLPVQGVLIVFLFTLSHECTHKTPFASPWLNEAAGHFVAVLILLPFRAFRYFHLAHHRWTNIPGKDPELAAPLPATRAQWVWLLSGAAYWTAQAWQLALLVAGTLRADWLPDGARAGAVAEARWMVAFFAGVIVSLFVTPVLFWVWLLPAVLGMPVLRLYLLAEHGDCPQVADMFANTRTTFTNGLVRFLAWNMPYHAEHHVWPAVPFYQLPGLHADMKQHLQVTSEGYVAFNRAYLARHV